MITIGTKTFKNQKDAKDFVRALLHSIGSGDIFPNEQHWSFFVSLLDHHSNPIEKIGCGIRNFEIRRNKLNTTLYETLIRRKDNSVIDFSWNSCVRNKH
jgi:hypothetical protein